MNVQHSFSSLQLYLLQRKERAEQIAYKLEQDLALCKYTAVIGK